MSTHLIDAGERGQLTIHQRVVEKLAATSALEVQGACEQTQLLGRSLPKVKADLAGNIAILTIDVAVFWPTPVDSFSAQVRDRVTSTLLSLAGITARRVNVNIVHVEVAGPTKRSVA